jgi:hypothetical protein
MRVGHLELGYTLRDIDDEHLAARLTSVLPRLNAMAEADDARHEQARTARSEQPSAPSLAHAGDLAQLVQQAVQQVLGQAHGSKPLAAEPQGHEAGDSWCALHREWMPQRSNANGTWCSHWAEDADGSYYCRGRGRGRQNRR